MSLTARQRLKQLWRDYDGGMYVVVNVSRRAFELLPKPGEHHVMPGEEPHTYGTLDDAVYQYLDLAAMFSHTLETAPIFKLVPVSQEEIEAAIKRVGPEWERDNSMMD